MTLSHSHKCFPSAEEAGVEVWERLADLERRSLLAEQARQLAHRMRTPLNVIELICETLQIELQHEQNKAERLDSVLDAVARLSTTLTDTVKSNRFTPGPARAADAVELAAQLVRLHGGEVDGVIAAGPWPRVMIDPKAFEAAILHALRLIGVGGQPRPRPILQCEVVDGVLKVRLAANGVARAPAGMLNRDSLMALAAERVARDSGGKLALDEGAVTFLLPVAED
ncbi:histidine kinase [Thioflavicoccus mobilis 8321]|uniref:histidine kinase n=1 Tax=Thioflavicoccus mobilis 8321 TaxID=765912 RepID=L0GW27_9GAMM|nr:histidine kinase dimerization/phospho-acceptor domain-containing protein [Thioflavicoccus mobilis]AGA90196.1 histidine kinase [Thioflavicoccus mobilis 8321]